MRCIWSTTAIRILTAKSEALSYGRARFFIATYRPVVGQPKFPTTRRVSASSALSHSHALSGDAISVDNAVDAVPESSTSLPSLLVKPSKASFAAAQAIRMCIGNGGIADGFFVLNSIRYASHRHQKFSALPFKMPGMTYSRPEFEAAALRFGPNVSQRLSAHALLHGLIRNGLAELAFELAKLMMAEGVALRSVTFESIMETLVSSGKPRTQRNRELPFASPNPSTPLKHASDVLVLRPSMMADQRTRFALQLLFLARRHRQRRTDNMFKLFMAASLLNGELIIFSLLFGWTCRDWQTAYSLAANLEAIPEDDSELQSSSQVIASRARLNHLRKEAIFPDRDSLESALSVINTILARTADSPTPTHDRLSALQALGNLAGLLDRRQIPFPEIATLLRTMYKCPRVEDEIWIVGLGGCPERIKAHEYFHRVLSKLMHSLPVDQPSHRPPSIAPDALFKGHRYDMLPPLEVSGYNALLHYALRHRLSPALGEAVLSHMMKKRWEPISPDTATANILLRSGSLLRRYDIATKVLQSMGTPAFLTKNRSEIVPDHTRWGSKLGRMSRETIEVPQLPSSADIYTLTSYISHLTSTGQPREVNRLLFSVIPELDSTKYPTNSERREDRRPGRVALLAALHRAITLGPVFFSAILNALHKSGQPALADRVWQLAKTAERCSWTRRHVPECKPWILGPHAYTTMLNCYGALARRQRPWILKLHPTKRISKRTARHSVWASFQYECQKLPMPMSSHEVLLLLRRFMGQAALDVFRRLVGLRAEYKRLPLMRRSFAEELPQPDARFFNAALRVFRPHTPPMQKSWYRKRLRDATRILEAHDVVPENDDWNAPLHEVAEHMVRAGYTLPLGLRYMFVGRLDGINRPSGARPDHGPAGYRTDQHISFMRYRLATPKEKGLPVSKTYMQFREMRRRRWQKRLGKSTDRGDQR
ncbi:hypothetical protein GGX14DRAFT_510170 [Mycena pura]|uniref:Uncharacterized protein n=1 Tax=Mycena pura TaxID=153505 RepID=A0AAD6YTZ5_9AGAR|nr:hypothetical protein GGX14DRAFT_510170 [Mycena pura]